MNLFGEAIHNFIDGLVIAAAFVTNISLGISTSIAIALHEIPQEISDFGVLVSGGYKKSKALLLNFSVALTIVLGGLFGFYLSQVAQASVEFLLPIAAGGFIYISATDLIPMMREGKSIKYSIAGFIIFLASISIIYLL